MLSSTTRIDGRKDQLERVVRAAIVIACYLIVFMGLLLTVAGGAGAR